MIFKPFCILFLLLFAVGSDVVLACKTPLRSVSKTVDDNEERFTRKVLAKAGCEIAKVKFPVHVTLERRMSLLEQGKIDIIIGVNRRPEREFYAHFTIPFAEEKVRLWAIKGTEKQYANFDLITLATRGGIFLLLMQVGTAKPLSM